MMLVKVVPTFGDKALARGPHHRARRLSRRLLPPARPPARLPLSAVRRYHDLAVRADRRRVFPSPAPLQALGLSVGHRCPGRHAAHLDAPHDRARGGRARRCRAPLKKPEMLFAGCRTANLPLYFVGPEADSVALYEQLFAHCKGIYFRCLDEFGDPVVYPAPSQCLHQVGFEREDALFPERPPGVRGVRPAARIFRVSAKVSRLQSDPPRRGDAAAQGQDRRHPVRLRRGQCAARRGGATFDVRALCGAGGQSVREDHGPHRCSNRTSTNITSSRIAAIISTTSRIACLEVYAHYPGGREKVPVPPLYSASLDAPQTASGPYFTVRRLPRLRTVEEKRQRRVLRLYRHRYVHLAERARRHRRRLTRSPN